MHHRGPVRATEKETATLNLMLFSLADPPSHQEDRGSRTQFCSPDLTQGYPASQRPSWTSLPKAKFLAYYQVTY